jgi:hypothetical protein
MVFNRKRTRSDSSDQDQSAITKKANTSSSNGNDGPKKAVDASVLASLQASIAAQIAATTQKLSAVVPPSVQPIVPTSSSSKKADLHVLRLDSQGREVDENGNIITRMNKPILSSVANQRAAKKASNPYLAHHESNDHHNNDEIDSRIVTSSRVVHGKKAFQFYDAGSLVQAEVKAREQARAHQVIDRHHPEVLDRDDICSSSSSQTQLEMTTITHRDIDNKKEVPIAADKGVVPIMEWWDLDYLPIHFRKTYNIKKDHILPTMENFMKTQFSVNNNQKNKDLIIRSANDITKKLQLSNSKTYKLVQHPPSIQSLKPDAEENPLSMHLTKQERKKIRTQKRMAIEQERRDKQMMGLIPAPEPKFKLSNFMKILGDQAVADPSIVEQKVLEQMKKRELKHEMDNLARKLTPLQRYEKKINKLKIATIKAREMHVAVFSVNDLDAPRLRYKVDINAQSWLLTGTALICQQGHVNLVLVEGGPRAIKKFTRLMMHRIKWGKILTASERQTARDRRSTHNNSDVIHDDNNGSLELTLAKDGSAMDTNNGVDDVDSDDDDDDDDDDLSGGDHASSGYPNICRLVWSGVSATRHFSDFRFRECRTQSGAKKLLEGHFLHPYWSLAVQQEQAKEDQ